MISIEEARKRTKEAIIIEYENMKTKFTSRVMNETAKGKNEMLFVNNRYANENMLKLKIEIMKQGFVVTERGNKRADFHISWAEEDEE